jgi:hypothetical protein
MRTAEIFLMQGILPQIKSLKETRTQSYLMQGILTQIYLLKRNADAKLLDEGQS